MSWIASDLGTMPCTISFQLPTAVDDNNEGGTALGLSLLEIPVRLKMVSQSERNQLEQAFPGTNTNQALMFGWVGNEASHSVYKFPATLRGWSEFPEGSVSFQQGGDTYTGRIEIQVQPFAIEEAAQQIGERFTARFTFQ